MGCLLLLLMSLLVINREFAWSHPVLNSEQLTEELMKMNKKFEALEERMNLSNEIGKLATLGEKLTEGILKLTNSTNSRWHSTGDRSAGLINVALNKPARQSSTCCGGTASRAVDGHADPNYSNMHCTATSDPGNPGPWWRVDLLESYEVRAVTITNRRDCCGERLRDFYVEIFSEDPAGNPYATSTLCYHYPGTMPGGATQTLYCLKPAWGRYVRIKKPASVPLTLCGVDVLVPART
ncbi:hypothetical protein BaRGS_00038754 [Batillaria attramentaria]|uniref:Fucolectin tachylectin-4 pentraxin-1 domain-containing protein n=1 Tax=Batillaria attramentaria TaxID=370345 RepID=A0ABD0J5B2_9CAEN